MNDLGGRKFIFSLVLVCISAVFVVFEKTSVKNWMDFVALVGSVYIAGNVVAKFGNEK